MPEYSRETLKIKSAQLIASVRRRPSLRCSVSIQDVRLQLGRARHNLILSTSSWVSRVVRSYGSPEISGQECVFYLERAIELTRLRNGAGTSYAALPSHR